LKEIDKRGSGIMKLFWAVLTILLLAICNVGARAQSSAPDDDTGANSAPYAKQLSSLDPVTRQAAAEALAHLVALDQKKLIEGYVLQEKDKRVRLALNWALYRMGKSTVLFQIARDLGSSRHDQAAGYLSQLESAEPLYLFLRQDNTRPKVTAGVIEVLGRIGDIEALQQIKPFLDSYDPKISEAAQSATSMIQHRLGEGQPATKTRPRTTAAKTDLP
jgi:HEAT repeat protein